VRAARTLIATTLVALICVAAAVAQPSKIKLTIVGISHSYLDGKGFICARISGTAGSSLFIEAYGPGVANQHVWTQALLPPRGSVVVGFPVAIEGAYRIKVTANKPKQGRSVATRDYLVPPALAAARGTFACA
jgi:hypothetical protein